MRGAPRPRPRTSRRASSRSCRAGPAAFHKRFHPDGEPGVARAAKSRNVLHCVSTLSTTTLEEAAAPGQPRWFQLYVHKDRALTRELVERAEAAGYEALVLTVDAP